MVFISINLCPHLGGQGICAGRFTLPSAPPKPPRLVQISIGNGGNNHGFRIMIAGGSFDTHPKTA